MKTLISSITSLFGFGKATTLPRAPYGMRKDILKTLPIGGIYTVEPGELLRFRKSVTYHSPRMKKKFSVRRNNEGRYDLRCVA